MRTTQQFSITLPHEMADVVRRKVAAGEYATESEVIRDGLRVRGHSTKRKKLYDFLNRLIFTARSSEVA